MMLRKFTVLRILLLSPLILPILLSINLKAEGTKELRPTAGEENFIKVRAENGSNATFATLNRPATQRLNVRICSAGETVYLGFNAKPDFRLYVFDPNRVPVINNQALTTGPGVITTYNQAVNGPNLPGVTNGYNALSFTATVPGDYSIEFQAPNNAEPDIELFDVTVVSNGQKKPGRLWSSAWMVTTNGGNNPFNSDMYVYTDDGITTKIDFNGIKPFEFVISSNSTGTDSTGNVMTDRRSNYGNKTYPEYKIFLNAPDPSCFPPGEIGQVVGDPTITGCPGDYCINVNVTRPGTMIFTIDPDKNGYQDGTADRVIQGKLVAGMNCVKWDGKDGLGNQIGNNAAVGLKVQYLNGLTHLPMFDAEAHSLGYKVTYVNNASTQNITLFWDDSQITKATDPQKVNAITGCSNTGGCHTWSGLGDNSNAETINTWWYVKESSVNVANNIIAREIDANRSTPGKGKLNDTSVCASTKDIPLKGLLRGESAARWSIITGTGAVADVNSLVTKYTLSAADANLTYIRLLLSSVNTTCIPIQDTITIFLEAVPTLTMPAPFNVCASSASISTSAQFTNAPGIAWTGSGGTFVNANNTSIQYTPSSNEVNLEKVTLSASTTSKPEQLCPIVSGTVEIGVKKGATLIGPKDTTICSGTGSVNLTFTAQSNSDSLIWTSSGPTPNPRKGLSSSFTIANSSSALIFLTAYLNGCTPIRDTVQVTNVAAPTITLPEKICFYNTLNLTANVANAPLLGTYDWKFNNTSVGQSGTSISVTQPGNYSYHYNFNGVCEIKAVTRVLTPPVIDNIDTIACANEQATLIAKEITGATYYWGPSQITTTTNVYTFNPGTGISNFPVIIEDANKCRDTITAEVEVMPIPMFTISGEQICPGQSKQIITTLTDPLTASRITKATWFKNGAVTTASSSWNSLPYNDAGQYSLQIWIAGCGEKKDYNVTYYPTPKFDIHPLYKFCFETDPPVTLVSNPFVGYKWTTEDGVVLGTSDRLTVSPTTLTTYKLIATNEYGCKDSTKMQVKPACPPRLFVPNVITPTSPDINSSLHIFGAHYTNFEINIFNRWGEVIFRSKDPKEVWNGIYKNEQMPIGNYPWVVTYEGDSEEYKGPYKLVGDVTVVR